MPLLIIAIEVNKRTETQPIKFMLLHALIKNRH